MLNSILIIYDLMNACSENENGRLFDLSSTSMSSQFGATSLGVSVDNVSLGSAPRSEAHDVSDKEVAGEQSAAAKVQKLDVRAERDGLTHYLYIQMELCKRESLSGWLERDNSRIAQKIIESGLSSPAPNESHLNAVQQRNRLFVLTIFSQMVSAITYIHSQGLIHRNLKVY